MSMALVISCTYSIFQFIPYNAFHPLCVFCQSKSVSLPSESLPARRDVLTTVKSLILLWNRLLFFRGYCRSANGMRIGFGKDKDDIFPFLSRHVCVSRLMCMFKDRFIKFGSLNERPNNSHQVNYFHRRWGNILSSYPSEYLFNPPKHGNHQ